MSATRVQRATTGGQVVAVGFSGGTISCMIRDGQNVDGTGDLQDVPDEAGDTCITVASNLGESIQAQGALLSGQDAPKMGDIVTISTTKYLVRTVQKAESALVTRISMTLTRNLANDYSTSSAPST